MDQPDAMPSSLSRLRERAGVRAQALRQNPTDAESVLWFRLRNRQLLGLKFRRQHPIGRYIADFACLEVGLVIEVDGGPHVANAPRDAEREEAMAREGFRTLRFWNHEVLNETVAVMDRIRQVAETLTPTLSRKREREQDRSNP